VATNLDIHLGNPKMPEPNRINITICGDGGCGKSSITLRLVKSVWMHEYDPTIEDSYSLTRTIDGVAYHISLTDTAGQEEYRSLASNYSRQADAFLLVYDITAPGSLYDQLPYFIDLIRVERESREDRGEVAPVMLVAGNKCDLKDERKISAREGLEWARGMNCGFMETSARENVNIEESFTRQLLIFRFRVFKLIYSVLVRRVIEARRAHAEAQNGNKLGSLAPNLNNVIISTPPSTSARNGKKGANHQHGSSFSETKPLPPLDEKERWGSRWSLRNRDWWAWARKLKCWSSK
jgi:GTPase KRas